MCRSASQLEDSPILRNGEPLAGLDAKTAAVSDFKTTIVLAQIETGARGEELARFFALLVGHTMEGFYGDPGNGGNRGRIAWEMIGFEVRG